MGLGKTMQAITAIRLLVHHGQLRRVLLVCPKPLVTNWQREFAQWAPELPVERDRRRAGPPAMAVARRRRRRDESPITKRWSAIATTFATRDNHYDLVVLDESQRIKNAASTTNEVVRSIPAQPQLGTDRHADRKQRRGLASAFSSSSRPASWTPKMKPRAVGRAVSDYVLRRTKDQVLTDLPPKLFRDADVELSPEQAESYRLAEDEGVVRLREMKHELTIQHVFELVLRLKQICNFDPTTGASSKFERLEADLEECAASGRKAIVFSQWVQTLTELRSRLARFSPAEYHGQVPNRRRDAVIDQFRDDPNCHVMLMTLRRRQRRAQSAIRQLRVSCSTAGGIRPSRTRRSTAPIASARSGRSRSRVFCARTRSSSGSTRCSNGSGSCSTRCFSDDIAAPSAGLSREEIFSLFNLDRSGEAKPHAA